MGITNRNGNRPKTMLNLGLGKVGNGWEWEGMGLKKTFPLICIQLSPLSPLPNDSACHVRNATAKFINTASRSYKKNLSPYITCRAARIYSHVASIYDGHLVKAPHTRCPWYIPSPSTIIR